MSAGEGRGENPVSSFLRKVAYVISRILRINVILSILIVIAVAGNLTVMVESVTGYFGDIWRLAILIVCLAFTLYLFYSIDKFARWD